MIHINSDEYLLGDCLAQVPFMLAVSEGRGDSIRLTGRFNRHVVPLLEGLPIHFDPRGNGAGAEYDLRVNDSFLVFHKTGLHMVQGYFHHFGMPVPEMPITVPFKAEPCGLPPGIVVSPFSGSDNGSNTKLWPHDRWVQAIQTLRQLGLADRVYVLGGSPADQPAAYVAAGITSIFGRPMPQVLGLMQQAPLVMTIDTGTGHLAHYGGITKHLLVYPDCLPGNFAQAARAVHVRGPMPADITADQVVAVARGMLAS